MSIKLAKKVGFCFGVKRALDLTEEVLKKEKKVYSLGSIIHNEQVVKGLAARGLKVINSIGGATGGCIVISSHGISPHVAAEISRRSLKLVDTTCPFVLNAQKMAKRLNEAGYKVIIVGDALHPEVRALIGFAGKKAHVVKDSLGIKALRIKPNEKIGVLSQTTQSMDNFIASIRAVIEKKPKELRVLNTICKDAETRQAAARELAKNVDVMLIVGGKSSANTKRLFDVCKKILAKSYLVETVDDLRDLWFKGVDTVGITSGASTPEWIVKQVASKTKKMIRKEGCKR